MSRNLTSQLSQELRLYNKYEDTLDVFVNLLIKRSPTFFVLINMTLMIWLVQTIYQSRLDSIPRSIYFFAPFFTQKAFLNLYVSNENTCNNNFDKIILKTFPSIKDDNLNKKNLTKWGQQSIVFCAQISSNASNFSISCQQPLFFCSGYCVENIERCPITNIKRLGLNEKAPQGYTQFYRNQFYSLSFSRDTKNDFIVGLSAQYKKLCVNDFKYFEKYQKFSQYWNETENCGEQGSLTTQIFHPFLEMPVKDFLLTNQIWSSSIQNFQFKTDVILGAISTIKFNNKTLQCNKAEYISKNLKDYISEEPVKPTFTQSMLIIAFVFFTLSWAWLLGFYCFQGSRKQKNMIMILMIIIELIVITFLYSQNVQMFESQKIINEIARCVETQLQATSHWSFGITNSSPFKSIMYCCTCFLMLQIVAQFIDRRIYVQYYAVNQQNNYQAQQGRCKCC